MKLTTTETCNNTLLTIPYLRHHSSETRSCSNFSLSFDWYTDNRLTLNVKKTKIMLAGSKTMLLKFENFKFSLEGGQIDVWHHTGLEMELENTYKLPITETWPSVLGG